MKAVMLEVPPHILEQRRVTGADRFDEMWDGVLHMVPPPSRSHQDIEGAMEHWLRSHWAQPLGNRVYHQIAVTPPENADNWIHNYRIPDLVLLTPDRFHIDRDRFFAGPPAAVVEIRGSGDETYEKLPFYAGLGIPEVWIIEHDDRAPQLHRLRNKEYTRQKPDENGWLHSETTGIQLRSAEPNRIALRLAADESTERTLPD